MRNTIPTLKIVHYFKMQPAIIVCINILSLFLIIIMLICVLAMTYLEFGLESVNYKMIKTNIMRAFEIKIGSLKSFIYNPIDVSSGSSSISTDEDTLNNRDNLYFATRDIEQVMFITSSEKDTNGYNINIIVINLQFC